MGWFAAVSRPCLLSGQRRSSTRPLEDVRMWPFTSLSTNGFDFRYRGLSRHQTHITFR
jgi:hypothetical protein